MAEVDRHRIPDQARPSRGYPDCVFRYVRFTRRPAAWSGPLLEAPVASRGPRTKHGLRAGTNVDRGREEVGGSILAEGRLISEIPFSYANERIRP